MNIPVLILAAAAMVCTALPAAAQRVWRWTPAAPPAGSQVVSNMLTAYVAPNGASGLLILERHTKGSAVEVKLRIVWISKKGHVHKDLLVERPDEPVAAVTGAEAPAGTYTVLYVADRKFAATDGKTIWTWRIKKGKEATATTPAVPPSLVTSTSTVPEGVDVLPTMSGMSFRGWLQRETGARVEADGDAYPFTSLSLIHTSK